MSIKFRPLRNRVLIKRIVEQVTAGGIVIPDTAGEKPQRGKVLAVGPGKYENGALCKVSVAVNDEVLFAKYSGTDIKIDSEEYLVMSEDDILGVVDK